MAMPTRSQSIHTYEVHTSLVCSDEISALCASQDGKRGGRLCRCFKGWASRSGLLMHRYIYIYMFSFSLEKGPKREEKETDLLMSYRYCSLCSVWHQLYLAGSVIPWGRRRRDNLVCRQDDDDRFFT